MPKRGLAQGAANTVLPNKPMLKLRRTPECDKDPAVLKMPRNNIDGVLCQTNPR